MIDGVAVAPTETSPPADDSNSMSFNLQTTAGLAVQIHTKMPTSNVVIELQSKLEFALFKLNECEQRLDAAMRTIGSLEARLESKTEELHKLSSEA